MDQDHYERDLALRGRSLSSTSTFSRNLSSYSLTVGARVDQVDEPRILFIFELEAYPEPKILSIGELIPLYKNLKSFKKVAALIGASEAFVRQTCQNKKKR